MKLAAFVCVFVLGFEHWLFAQTVLTGSAEATLAAGPGIIAGPFTEEGLTESQISLWARGAGLTEDQKKAFRALRRKHIEAQADLDAKIKEKRLELAEAMVAAHRAGNAAALAKLSQEDFNLFAPYINLLKRNGELEANFLTPEQKKRLEENMPTIIVEDSVSPVKLSHQQFARVMSLLTEMEKSQGRQAAHTRISSVILTVVTPQQKEEILTARSDKWAKGVLQRVAATPAQREQTKEIIKEVVKRFDFDKEWPNFPSLDETLLPRLKAIFTPEQQEKAGNILKYQLLPAGAKKGP